MVRFFNLTFSTDSIFAQSCAELWELLEPIPDTLGHRQDVPWSGRQSITEQSSYLRDNLVTNQPMKLVYGLGKPGEILLMHGENIQTQDSNHYNTFIYTF